MESFEVVTASASNTNKEYSYVVARRLRIPEYELVHGKRVEPVNAIMLLSTQVLVELPHLFGMLLQPLEHVRGRTVRELEDILWTVRVLAAIVS